MDLIERQHIFLEEQFDLAVKQVEKSEDCFVSNLYKAFISLSKESIKECQKSISEDTKLRDKISNDLEAGQMIWDLMEITQEIIKQELFNIKHYQEVIINEDSW